MSERTILVWFRNDLRTHDHEVLVRALDNGNKILPVYCFDPAQYEITQYGHRKTGALRASFILKNVAALKKIFQAVGGDLLVQIGTPEEILPILCQRYQVDEVYHHREVAFEETQSSSLVESALWKQQINLRHFIGHTLYHKEDLPFPIRDIPDNFSQFKKRIERESSVRPQLSSPEKYRFLEEIEASELPSLETLGFTSDEVANTGALSLLGGESAAIDLLNNYLNSSDFSENATLLGPYVSCGALSPNTFFQSLLVAATHSPGLKKRWETQFQKLMWRDYYRFMFKKHGNRFFKLEGVLGEEVEEPIEDLQLFEQWKHGNTGESIIDKAMITLRETGMMSDLDRQVTATFFVHHLKLNWLWGASWFEAQLLDYNPCSNYGNWAHIAGVGSSVRDNKRLDIQKFMV